MNEMIERNISVFYRQIDIFNVFYNPNLGVIILDHNPEWADGWTK